MLEVERVLVLAPEFGFDADWEAAFRTSMPGFQFVGPETTNPDDILVALVYDPPPGALARYQNLEVILALSAGTEVLLSDPSLPDVPVIRLANSEMVSAMREYILYQTLRLHRDFARIEALQGRKRWEWALPSIPSAKCRVSILGLGRLGGPCALALRDLGFLVSGWSRRRQQVQGVQCFSGLGGLAQLVTNTDILICLLPLTEETRGILSKDLFGRMPRGSRLINASRGGCVVDADLLEALDSGQLAHATLDVFNLEPLPDTHPFWEHPCVTITPHIAANPGPAACAQEVGETIRRLKGRRPLLNVVDRMAGY